MSSKIWVRLIRHHCVTVRLMKISSTHHTNRYYKHTTKYTHTVQPIIQTCITNIRPSVHIQLALSLSGNSTTNRYYKHTTKCTHTVQPTIQTGITNIRPSIHIQLALSLSGNSTAVALISHVCFQ